MLNCSLLIGKRSLNVLRMFYEFVYDKMMASPHVRVLNATHYVVCMFSVYKII